MGEVAGMPLAQGTNGTRMKRGAGNSLLAADRRFHTLAGVRSRVNVVQRKHKQIV